MSEHKRAELVAAGKLAPDGTRVETCPLCGQSLPDGVTIDGAVVETVEVATATETEVER